LFKHPKNLPQRRFFYTAENFCTKRVVLCCLLYPAC
jgi:hypothetical protein